MSERLRVGITRDILDARGEPAFGNAALDLLDRAPGIDWEYLPDVVAEITAEHAARYDALYVNLPRVPAAAVARADCRLRIVARHGVGYDSRGRSRDDAGRGDRHAYAELDATPGRDHRADLRAGTRRPAVRQGPADARRDGGSERMDNMGIGLTGRTLGVVGAGRIGKELLRMARVFDLELLAADPYVNAIELAYIGARQVPTSRR